MCKYHIINDVIDVVPNYFMHHGTSPIYISIISQLPFFNWQHEQQLLQSISPFDQQALFWFRPCWKHCGYFWGLPLHAMKTQEGMSSLGFFPSPMCSPQTSSSRLPASPWYAWPASSHSSSFSFSATPCLCMACWSPVFPSPFWAPNSPLMIRLVHSLPHMIPLISLPMVLTPMAPSIGVSHGPWWPLHWILPLILMAPPLESATDSADPLTPPPVFPSEP